MKSDSIKQFRNSLRRFLREIDLVNYTMTKCEVTEAQCHALLEINLYENMTVNQLANKLSLDKSTVSRTIEKLYKKGLIDRITNKNNRRTVMLKTTINGEQVVKTINDENNLYFKEVFSNLGKEEINQFLTTFSKITQNMNNINNPKL